LEKTLKIKVLARYTKDKLTSSSKLKGTFFLC